MAPQSIDIDSLPTFGLEEPESPRLVLAAAFGRGRLDGGWWPHSRDARVELPALVSGLNTLPNMVIRLSVDVLAWDDLPRRVTVAGHVVRLGWFANMNHKIIVTRIGSQNALQLLVVPPEAEPAAARAALALAARIGFTGPQDILESCGIATEPISRLSTRRASTAR